MSIFEIEENFQKNLLNELKTSLIHTGVEILDYYKEGEIEYLKLLFPFTTTGNILTYSYNRKTCELSLIDALVYTIDETKYNKEEALVDRNTILKLYDYSRNKLDEYINKIMEQIYNMIIDDSPLTNEDLINQGITQEEITMLLNYGILKVNESNEYTLSSINRLYRYGIKILLTESPKRANKCFRKCYQIDPQNREVCLQILYSYIRLDDYTEAFKWFSQVENASSKKHRRDNNLYLYMISQLTNCEEQYQERIANITTKDTLIPYNGKQSKEYKLNDIRIAIMKNKYKYALSLLNNVLATDFVYDIKLSLQKELLLHLIRMEEKFRLKLLHIAKTKKYGIIILFLNEKANKRNLGITEKCISLVAEDILDITRTKDIKEKTIGYTDSVYEAIEGKNYQLAQTLNREFIISRQISPEDDVLDTLLTDINELISRIKEDKKATILDTSQEQLPEDLNQISKYAEDLAYYINSERLSLTEAEKLYNLNQEQILLAKIIYARDYYTVGFYHKGDELIQEVELSEDKTARVISLLNEVKTNRMLYINQIKPHTRKKTPPKPNN